MQVLPFAFLNQYGRWSRECKSSIGDTICAYIQKSNLVARAFLRWGEGEPTVSPPSPRRKKALGTRLTKEIYWLTPIDDCFFNPLSVFWQDVAGSGVVHALGGTVALIGAYTVGPRLGKFGDDGKPRMLQGHTVPVSTPFFFFLGWKSSIRVKGGFHLLAQGGGGRQDCGEGCYVMLQCLIGGLF